MQTASTKCRYLHFLSLIVWTVFVASFSASCQKTSPSPATSATPTASNMTRFYDLTTETVSTMPTDKIEPGMIKANIPEVGTVWVNAEELQPQAEPQHELDASVLPYIDSIKAHLDEVYPQSREEWIAGFEKDSNPEKEIAIWIHIGEKYQAAIAGKTLSLIAKRDYFFIFLSCCNSGREDALLAVEPEELSRKEAEAAVRFFFDPTSD